MNQETYQKIADSHPSLCRSCIFARRAASEEIIAKGYTACFLPLIAEEREQPMEQKPWSRLDGLDIGTSNFIMAQNILCKDAVEGRASPLAPENIEAKAISINSVLLIRGCKACPWRIARNSEE